MVADPEIRERLERAAEAGVGSRPPLAEQLGVREERDTEIPPDEAPPRRADQERERGIERQLLDVVADARVDPAEQALSTQRLALVRERDDDPPTLTENRAELVLRLGEPAR